MVDSAGRSVAGPLRKGSPYCLFHARPFATKPACISGPVVTVYLDLEATGLDVARDRICEIAATQGQDAPHIPGGCYAEVVYVPEEILRTPGAQAAARVHGIPEGDIVTGTPFPIAWTRFLSFTEAVLNTVIHESNGESEDESPVQLRPPDDPPSLLICAHNGLRFDFAMLLFECERHKLPMTPFRRWFFLDTLHVVDSAKGEIGNACSKLQCLVNTLADTQDLRAHRALDDTLALRHVMHSIAYSLGCSLRDLLLPHAFAWDEQASVAQVAALLED